MKNDLLSVCRDILLPVVFLLPSFLLTCRRRRRRQTCYARKTHVRPSLTRLDYTRLTRAARAASAVHAVTAVHERVNPLRRCGDLRMRVCGILGHRLSSFSILSLLLPSSLFPLPSSLFPLSLLGATDELSCPLALTSDPFLISILLLNDWPIIVAALSAAADDGIPMPCLSTLSPAPGTNGPSYCVCDSDSTKKGNVTFSSLSLSLSRFLMVKRFAPGQPPVPKLEVTYSGAFSSLPPSLCLSLSPRSDPTPTSNPLHSPRGAAIRLSNRRRDETKRAHQSKRFRFRVSDIMMEYAERR